MILDLPVNFHFKISNIACHFPTMLVNFYTTTLYTPNTNYLFIISLHQFNFVVVVVFAFLEHSILVHFLFRPTFTIDLAISPPLILKLTPTLNARSVDVCSCLCACPCFAAISLCQLRYEGSVQFIS